MARLCVNIDHIAILRQARRASPCICAPTAATSRTARCGDPPPVVKTRLIVEMASTREMVKIAPTVKPDQARWCPSGARS